MRDRTTVFPLNKYKIYRYIQNEYPIFSLPISYYTIVIFQTETLRSRF